MIPTAMNGFADMADSAQARLLDMLSLRRWGRPEDVADLCLLPSERCGAIHHRNPRRRERWKVEHPDAAGGLRTLTAQNSDMMPGL